MDYQNWLEANQRAILQRLNWLHRQPDGNLFLKHSPFHDIVVHKANNQMQLLFRDPTASDVMSRLDLRDPLRLVAAYTQALMLGPVVVDEPGRVYMIGFGAGRVPLVLHHYFPEVEIESTELDPAVVEIATRFFGISLDERLKVIVQDGRNFLTGRSAQERYDLIIVDAFRGTGYGPYRFATTEFYRLCQSQLTKNGAVLVSLLDIDPLYRAKILTFCRAFPQAYLCFYQDATILIGTTGPELEPQTLRERVLALEEKFEARYPLLPLTENLLSGESLAEYLSELAGEPVLTDGNPPAGYFESLPPTSTVFSKARKDDPCPCESGKKFRHCHGRLLA
jgi:spermidine synthase